MGVMETTSSTRDGSEDALASSTAEARFRSCMVCAKAKSKCVRRLGHDACERCTRLRKECRTRELSKRKRNSIKLTRTAQLKHLEAKLEDIAHALSSQQGDGSSATTALDHSSSRLIPQPRQPYQHHVQTSPTKSSESGTMPIDTSPAQGSSCRTCRCEDEGNRLNVRDAEVLFDRYQRLMASCMPFVIIPTGTAASSLQPFLLQAITTVACFHDTATQQIMVKELMREISERILINGEKSLDLLQGILILCNWYNPHLFLPQNHNSLLHLAMALTLDLNIDRPPGSCEKAALITASKSHGIPQPTKVISNEERRAVLGTFYLTSMIFVSFRKVDVLQWTPWHTQCADALSLSTEYESDIYLVQLVQSQRIKQEAMSTNYDHAPLQFYAKSFLSDLDAIGSQPGSGRAATILRLQKACTRAAIWERSFADLHNNSKANPSDLRQRLDGMWRCMEAVKAYIDVYMAMNVEDYPLVPFGVFAHVAYIFVVIIRASSINVEGWDVQAVREFVDFSTLMEEASCRYDTVCHARPDGLVLKNDAFTRWSAKTRWLKTFYDTKFMPTALDTLAANQSTIDSGSAMTQSVSQGLPREDPGHLTTSLDVSSSSWQNIFPSSEENFWNGFNNPLQLSELEFDDI